MKNLVTMVAIIAASLGASAQAKKSESVQLKSNIESLSEQSGTFSKKEFVDIGKAKDVSVQLVRVTDVITDKTVSGIKLEGVYRASYGSTTKSAYLDADEVDAFLKVVAYVNNKVFTSVVPETSVEYNFHARGGFSGGAYSTDKKWKGYVQLEKYDSNAYFFLDQESFKTLGSLVSQAKEKL